MILLLKIIFIIIILISFIGAIGESDREGQIMMIALCISSMFATVFAFMWL